jgi:hypothetical protein
MSLIPLIRSYFEYAISLEDEQLCGFSVVDWARLLVILILAFRLSFRLVECPGWDDQYARQEINLGGYLDRMGAGGADVSPEKAYATQETISVLDATRVVLGVVKDKFDRRFARAELNRQQSDTAGVTAAACPMMDGSLEAWMPYWAETFPSSGLFPSVDGNTDAISSAGPNADLWATMTMSWAHSDINFDGI